MAGRMKIMWFLEMDSLLEENEMMIWCEKCRKDTEHEEIGEEEFGAVVSGPRFVEILGNSLKNQKPLELPKTTWKRLKCVKCGTTCYTSRIID